MRAVPEIAALTGFALRIVGQDLLMGHLDRSQSESLQASGDFRGRAGVENLQFPGGYIETEVPDLGKGFQAQAYQPLFGGTVHFRDPEFGSPERGHGEAFSCRIKRRVQAFVRRTRGFAVSRTSALPCRPFPALRTPGPRIARAPRPREDVPTGRRRGRLRYRLLRAPGGA